MARSPAEHRVGFLFILYDYSYIVKTANGNVQTATRGKLNWARLEWRNALRSLRSTSWHSRRRRAQSLYCAVACGEGLFARFRLAESPLAPALSIARRR